MKSISRTCLHTALVVIGLGAIGTAFAGNNWASYDRKTYTGAQCQPAYGIHSKDFTIVQGRLRNDNAAPRYTSCAITFDSEYSVDQTDFDNTTADGAIEIRVYLDYSAVPDIVGTTYETSCTLAGRDLDGGGATKTETLAVSSGRTSTPQTLIFEGATWTGLSIGSNYSLQVSCLQPYNVALIGYKIYELGETGHYYYTPPL